MAEERLEWEKLPTAELVEELTVAGLRMPPGLVEEIAGRGQDAVAPLARLASDEALWESDGEERWAPLHALHLLGGIGDPAAITAVLDALRLNPEPDEIIENTPTIIGHLGPETIPAIAAFVLDETVDGLMRGVACDGLAAIVLLHPETDTLVTSFLRGFVENAEQHDVDAVTAACLALMELRDRPSQRAILDAIHAGRVDADLLTIEDAREAFLSPERISKDWHYTGDPLEYFSEERLEKMRKRHHG